MLTNSQMKADKKIRCGNYICFTLHSGLRITFGMDKTIAHTKLTIFRPVKVSIYQLMRCYCYHLHSNIKVAKFECRR